MIFVDGTYLGTRDVWHVEDFDEDFGVHSPTRWGFGGLCLSHWQYRCSYYILLLGWISPLLWLCTFFFFFFFFFVGFYFIIFVGLFVLVVVVLLLLLFCCLFSSPGGGGGVFYFVVVVVFLCFVFVVGCFVLFFVFVFVVVFCWLIFIFLFLFLFFLMLFWGCIDFHIKIVVICRCPVLSSSAGLVAVRPECETVSSELRSAHHCITLAGSPS